MPLDRSLPSSSRPARPAVLLACALFAALVSLPLTARADGGLCTQRCAERQSTCSAGCGAGDKCRKHCGNTADACFAQCQKSDDARQVAQQRRNDKACTTQDGRLRRCTAEERKVLQEGQAAGAKLICKGKRGEQIVCPDQVQKLEEAKKYLPKDKGGTAN